MTMPHGNDIETKAPKKGPSSRKAKTAVRTKKETGFFDFITVPLNEVAPLDWIPGPYQEQIKAAKPVQLSRPRVKRARGKTKKAKISFH